MDWSPPQLTELAHAAHHHATPHVRVKALAVLAVAKGQPRSQVALFYDTTAASVGAWVTRYRAHGLAALEIQPGRGRPRQVDEVQLRDYALQSPRNFGIPRSRWTLQLLAETVPSLQGFTATGVHHALRRAGLSWKRGQAWLLSPDPEFKKKRQVIGAALEHATRYPQQVRVLFQDEVSFYRQPSQARLWFGTGRRQPPLAWSQRANTLVRVTGTLDALSGQTQYLSASRINVKTLLRSYRELLAQYPQALLLYLVQDNWPVHRHREVLAFLAAHPRLQVLFLPTYAPRLNPIEKLWRWAKQNLCHAHPFCDDFTEYKRQLQALLAEAAASPAYIKHYCGLSSFKLYS
jgi:transposase